LCNNVVVPTIKLEAEGARGVRVMRCGVNGHERITLATAAALDVDHVGGSKPTG